VIETMTLLILLQNYLKEQSSEIKFFYLNMLKKSFSDPETYVEIPTVNENSFSSSDFTDREDLDQAVTATEIELGKLFSSNRVY
jgi:hypothetical protein